MRPQGSWVKAAGFTVVLFAVGVGISLGRGRIGPHPLPPSTSWRSASASASVEFGLTPPPPWRTRKPSVEFGITVAFLAEHFDKPPALAVAGCVPRLPSAPCIYKGHRPLPHPNHHTNLLPFESYLTNRIAQSDRMASAANVKLEDLGAAVDELDQIRQVLLLLSPSIGSSLASYVTIISSPFPCSDFHRGVSPVQQDFDVNGGGVCSSGSRAHHLVEHTSSSSVPSSVMDVQSLLPQAMTMSISTPELLLPLGEGTLDDVDDLLTRELRVPFLALGAAAAPYSGNGSDGGFAREHGMDAEQVIKPPNSVQLRPFVSVLVLIFAHCPVDPNSYFLFIFRGDHLLFFNCLCLFTTRTNRLLFSLSLSLFFCEKFYTFQLRYRPCRLRLIFPVERQTQPRTQMLAAATLLRP